MPLTLKEIIYEALMEGSDKYSQVDAVIRALHDLHDASPKLDGKFQALIVKNKDQSVVPDDEWVVFLAPDNAFAALVQHYPAYCSAMGASPESVAAAEALVARINHWRFDFPDRCKVPDVEPREIIL